MRLQVTSPADAVVGRYQFYVETKTSVSGSDKQEEFRYQYPEEIIVLFNPWCKGQCSELLSSISSGSRTIPLLFMQVYPSALLKGCLSPSGVVKGELH